MPPVTPEISRKPASQFPTDGCLTDFGTFDKHGFIYVPPCVEEQCQSAHVTGDSAAATQASSLQESDSPDSSRKPASQIPTDGSSIDIGTFDKHGFIYVPPYIEAQCQSAPGTGNCEAATQASSLQEIDSPDSSRKPASQFPTDGCSTDFGTFDKHGFIYVPPCIEEQCQSAPSTGDCAAATQESSLQESDSPDIIAPPEEGKVQKAPITEDSGESVGDVCVDKVTKGKLDVDSSEIITGGFPRAKLMDNLRCLVEINKMSKGVRRKKRKTSGDQSYIVPCQNASK
jgi:hypothetical protein